MPTCKKCQNYFPFYVNVDGKKRNLGNRKYCLNCSPFGERNTKKIHITDFDNSGNKQCSKCLELKPTDSFTVKKTENRISSWCKQCLYDNQKIRWKNRKLQAIKLMGGECCVCGYSKNYAAMEFHHLDPTVKEGMWSTTREKEWSKTVEELKKCILLCANCHREIHNPNALMNKEFFANSSLQQYKKISPTGKCTVCETHVFGTTYCSKTCVEKNKKKLSKLREAKKKTLCVFCQQELTENKFCSQKCFHDKNRKVQRPSKKELETLLEKNNYTQIGKMFGVSDNAIRKWKKSYDKK